MYSKFLYNIIERKKCILSITTKKVSALIAKTSWCTLYWEWVLKTNEQICIQWDLVAEKIENGFWIISILGHLFQSPNEVK